MVYGSAIGTLLLLVLWCTAGGGAKGSFCSYVYPMIFLVFYCHGRAHILQYRYGAPLDVIRTFGLFWSKHTAARSTRTGGARFRGQLFLRRKYRAGERAPRLKFLAPCFFSSGDVAGV